jgi:hypothetical protein
MKQKGYSQILDIVAGDQVPQNLNLAPNILTRIQKRKGVRMKSRTKLISATMLVVVISVVLFYTMPGMAAAIGRWFGYIPGIGLVREGQIRVLSAPVSVTRDGITVTVEQVILNQERTSLLYSVEGLPEAPSTANPRESFCDYRVSLRLPDGASLLAPPNGIQGWASGYQHRFDYAPLPVSVNDATLVIPCLFQVLPDAAAENWEIPLHFVPAPADMTAFPVIEISTTITSPATVTLPSQTIQTTTTVTPEALIAHPPTLTLDRAVQMDDGYLLYATIHWEDTPYNLVDAIDLDQNLHLSDANGQEMIFEVHNDEHTGVQFDQRQTVLAIKTAPVRTPDLLTLKLDAVMIDVPADVQFIFDPGPNPKTGHTWRLDKELSFGEHKLRLLTVTLEKGGYSFEMSSDTGIVRANPIDKEHTITSGFEADGTNGSFISGINYANDLPEGPITLTFSSIGVRLAQTLRAEWKPPAVSSATLPPRSASCLSAGAWQESLSHPPALPTGLPNRILIYGPVDSNNINGEWGVAFTNLDGSERRPIKDGRGDGSISADGTRLVYATIDGGIRVLNLESGQMTPVAGTTSIDINPIWTPNGARIVFNRGRGFFDLFSANPDGSDQRRLTNGGGRESTLGWLPDGSLLFSEPGPDGESIVYQLNLQTGESREYARESIHSISPDGKYFTVAELTFGDLWKTEIRSIDGPERWSLADGDLSVLPQVWSPDGEWLLISVSKSGMENALGALIRWKTCEVIPLPNLKDTVLDWLK